VGCAGLALASACDLRPASPFDFSVVASWAIIMAPHHHLVDSSSPGSWLEAVIALSTTQARFPEIQDSALTDLTMALGVGVRSAAGYPGRIQERWRRSPQSRTRVYSWCLPIGPRSSG
jgi:hypothetical protein